MAEAWVSASSGRDAAVGPDFEDQAVVVGALADAGALHGVTHAGHRREERVDGDDADGLVRLLVFVARAEAAADFDFELHLELLLLVERADDAASDSPARRSG